MLKRGFSLMEMMIVMLIVAVVAAASAPMINKKMLQDQANESPWVWTGTDNSIAYNLKGSAKQTAVIGAIVAPKKPNGDAISKLHIESDDTQLTLKKKGMEKSFKFKVDGSDGSSIYIVDDSTNLPNQPGCVAIGNKITASSSSYPNMTLIGAETYGEHFSTALGYKASAKSAYGGGGASTAIGAYSQTNGQKAVAIGASNNETNATKATGKYALAVGSGATASNESSIAIGGSDSATDATKAETTGSIAIGKAAKANTNVYTTAIGSYASATGSNSIAIGGGQSTSFAASAKAGRSIAIGCASVTENSLYNIAIGDGAEAKAGCAISIGSDARCTENASNGIAIGDEPIASGANSIVIGGGAARATASKSMALGFGAEARHDGSTAIGTGAVTSAANQIRLGTSVDTVYIPGNLVVDGTITTNNLAVKENFASNRAFIYDRFTVWGEGTARFRRAGNWLNRFMEPRLNDAEDGIWIDRGVVRKYAEADLYEATMGITLPAASDRRLKNVGEAFKAGLAEIKKLEVFNYTYKKDSSKTPHVGVMAQDLQKIFPKAVFKGEDGFLRIRMEDMFYALVNAVKELDAKINLLEQKQKRIDELEKRLDKLEKRLEKLEKGK